VKRLVIILSVFAVMIGFAVVDLLYTNSTYRLLEEGLIKVEKSIATYLESENGTIDNDTHNENGRKIILSQIEKVENQWNKRRRGMQMLTHHTIIRSMDERLTSMFFQIRVGNYQDAVVTLHALKGWIADLKVENHVLLENVF